MIALAEKTNNKGAITASSYSFFKNVTALC